MTRSIIEEPRVREGDCLGEGSVSLIIAATPSLTRLKAILGDAARLRGSMEAP